MTLRCEHQWKKLQSGKWMCTDCEHEITDEHFRVRMALCKIVSERDGMRNESDNYELYNAINEADDLLKGT